MTRLRLALLVVLVAALFPNNAQGTVISQRTQRVLKRQGAAGGILAGGDPGHEASRFLHVASDKPIKLGDNAPSLSVAYQCVIFFCVLYFFVGLLKIFLRTGEALQRIGGREKKSKEHWWDTAFHERVEALEADLSQAVREVPMLSIIILFAHFRTSVDLGYVGKFSSEYPTRLETAYYIAAGLVLGEVLIVVLGMCLAFCKGAFWDSHIMCATVLMETVLFLGECTSIGIIIFILHEVFTLDALSDAYSDPE